MRKIKSVEVLISGTEGGSGTYYVGQTINGLKIAEIKDYGNEYPNKRDSFYGCYDESSQPIITFDNCPVIVEYMEVPENK